jgi:hypothetical protein
MKTSDKFFTFHQANPHVYKTIVLKCRQYRNKHGSRAKLAIKMIFEVMRWDHLMSTDANDFKINNNYAPYYARLVMSANDDLADIFEIRESSS